MWGTANRKAEKEDDAPEVETRTYRPTRAFDKYGPRRVIFRLTEDGKTAIVFYEIDPGNRTYCTIAEWRAWVKETEPVHWTSSAPPN